MSPAVAQSRHRVTMSEIARRVGVSQATVSLVLNHAPGTRISQARRDRVFAMAREMGYRRLLPARDSSLVVALMINDLTTSQHVGPLIEGARDEAAANGCLLLVIPTNGSPECEAAAWELLAGRALIGVTYATLLTQTVTPPAFLRDVPGQTGVASAYGAAASIVTILLWIYYSSQIVLFGAEITKAYGDTRSARTEPVW